jgi:hypothetical protein
VKWLLIAAGVALVAVIAWSVLAGAPEAPGAELAAQTGAPEAPVRAVVPTTESPIIAVPDAGAIDAVDVDAGDVDAGPALEIAVEVFEANGERHAVGAGVIFTNDQGRVMAAGKTNVMGFMNVSLTPGVYWIGRGVEPPGVRIYADTHSISLRQLDGTPEHPRRFSGLVVNAAGTLMRGAEIELEMLDPRGHRTVLETGIVSDSAGRFALSAGNLAFRLRANWRNKLRSPWVNLGGVGPEVKLVVAEAVGCVKLDFAGINSARVYGQIEQGAVVREEELWTGFVTEVLAGHVAIRARAAEHGQLYFGRTELDVPSCAEATGVINLEPAEGLRVRVVDEKQDKVPGAELIGRRPCGDELRARTGLDGTVVLTPQRLCEYNPLFQLELAGIWRATQPQLARIGDEPATVVARPVDPALDSTDAATPVPWGGDR